MAKKRLLPGIDAVYDDEGVTFTCEGDLIEDMEFGWDDLADEELRDDVAQELTEYVDEEEFEDMDSLEKAAEKALHKLLQTSVARQALEELEDDDDGDDLDDYDD